MAKRHRSSRPAPHAATVPRTSEWPWALALAALVMIAYLPVWSGHFIWDDDLMVTNNPCITGPLGLTEIWTTSQADVCPLTLSTFWLEYKIWGLTPAAYHIVTILFHALGAVVLWRVLMRLGAPAAWFGAALWALHPAQAESVAWIAEMKNTESGVFFLLTILYLLRWLEAQKKDLRLRWNLDYSSMLFFAFLAMAAKSSTIVLPVVLCLCTWWQERDAWWRKAIFVAPLVVLSVIFAAVSMWTQSLQDMTPLDPMPVRSLAERIAEAGDAVWFYIGKLAWPYPLIAVYPRLKVDPTTAMAFVPLAAVFVVLIALSRLRTSWSRPCFFAFAYFVIALGPVLGLVDNFIFRYTIVFDHFQYLASMGPLALAGSALGLLAMRLGAIQFAPRAALAALALLLLAALTWQRATVYHSSAALWRDAMEKDPGSWLAYTNLGQGVQKEGHVDEAISLYQTALRLHPTSPETLYNLGSAHEAKGQFDEAGADFSAALAILPSFMHAHQGLGAVLVKAHRPDEAIEEFKKALAIRPDNATTYYDWGNALAQKNDMPGAAEKFAQAVKLEPTRAEFHNNLGAAYYQMGRLPEATMEFQEALRLDPHNEGAQTNLAKAYARAAKMQEQPPTNPSH